VAFGQSSFTCLDFADDIISPCWTDPASCSYTGDNGKWGSISGAWGELAEDKGTSFGLQGGYAINHQGSRPGRHGSRRVVYLGSLIHSSTGSTYDISRRSAITHAAMQCLEIRFGGHGSLPQRSWSCTTRASYQYSCMVRTAGRYLRQTHVRSMHSTSGVCVYCLASNGTNLFRQWCTEANEATQTHFNDPAMSTYSVWAYCAHPWQRRCQEDPVGLLSGRLEKTTRSSPHGSAPSNRIWNNNTYTPEAADLAQNRPLWRMISTYGAMKL